MKKSKLRFIKKISDKILNFILFLYYKDYTVRMAKFGVNNTLSYGLKIDSPEYLYISNNNYISAMVWLSIAKIDKEPQLIIQNDVWIGPFTQINCIDEVKIGNNVMIAARCYIGDAEHSFSNISMSISQQKIVSKGPISIGDDSWIGIGSTILPNVKIGKHCVIGANSVVTKDIPDYSVAVGNPAKVIKTLQ